MTREEEIKARLDEEFVHWIVDDRDFDYKVAGDSAEADIRYLLARNEKLQRRVDHLESGIQSALEYWNRSETDGAMVDALFTIEERLEKALDAKEQDAPATTDENATGGRG